MSIFTDPFVKMMKDLEDVKRQLRRLSANSHSIYTVLNENSPSTISTTPQNDYDPGEYDVLRITLTAATNFTGFSGGKQGRVLYLINVTSPTQNLNLFHENAGSAAANRIITPTGATLNITLDGYAKLYYDSTTQRWRVLDYQA